MMEIEAKIDAARPKPEPMSVEEALVFYDPRTHGREFRVTPGRAEATLALIRSLDERARKAEERLSPTYLNFFATHALGPKAAPSCLLCGQSTQGREVKVQHSELPGIVICVECFNLKERARMAEADIKTLGVIELMVRNPNLDSWCKAWEARTLKAEAQVSEQAKEIERLRGAIQGMLKHSDVPTDEPDETEWEISVRRATEILGGKR